MKTYRITGLGNAIVDSLARVDEDFLKTHGIGKGAMQLIDRTRAKTLEDTVSNARQVAGGSAANTIVTLAELGVPAAFIGKTKDDRFGKLFAAGMREHGVHFCTPPAPASAEEDTAHSVIFITPDGERSMNTYLGIAPLITSEDMDPAALENTDWLYIEGYLWDMETQKAACRKAIDMVKKAGGKVALTLSDPFCVERHRESFRALLGEVDLLFANEDELLSLYEEGDFDTAARKMAQDCALAAITRGEAGAAVLEGKTRWDVPAKTGVEVVDTTGAGDAFAAGFLWGHLTGEPYAVSARRGCLAAAKVIMHIGARADASKGADMKQIMRHYRHQVQS